MNTVKVTKQLLSKVQYHMDSNSIDLGTEQGVTNEFIQMTTAAVVTSTRKIGIELNEAVLSEA